MNIAIFTDTYSPQINGVVEVVKNLYRGLKRSGHRVYIIAPRIDSGRGNGRAGDNPDIYRIPSFPFPGFSEQRIALLYFKDINTRFIREKKIDIIHSQTPGTIGLVGVILARRLKLPHIHHYQTFFEDYVHYLRVPSRVGKLSVRNFSRWFCNMMDMITVPSYPFKTLLESYGIRKKIVLWNAGIDLAKFRKGTPVRQELGIPGRAMVLLFVGRLAREKNVSFLLEAMPELLRKRKNTYLLLAGDGPMREELERYARRLKISRNVIFTGYVASDRIPDIYHSADIFVFSSLTETQGLVTLEAMASGLPVVAVAAYGIKFILKDGQGAFLVGLNRREFVQKTLKLAVRKEYERMKADALQFVQQYSNQNAIRSMLKLYAELRKRHRKRPKRGFWGLGRLFKKYKKS